MGYEAQAKTPASAGRGGGKLRPDPLGMIGRQQGGERQ